MKFLYLKLDPFGADACKIGITSKPDVRLGVYQNSYYHGSHTATFDYLWVGDDKNINNIEKTLKTQMGLSIQKEGRGHSEWISEPAEVVLNQISETINGYRYKVFRATERPVTVYNLDEVIDKCKKMVDNN